MQYDKRVWKAFVNELKRGGFYEVTTDRPVLVAVMVKRRFPDAVTQVKNNDTLYINMGGRHENG